MDGGVPEGFGKALETDMYGWEIEDCRSFCKPTANLRSIL